jgi:mono/diheme cytochrome c family protein
MSRPTEIRPKQSGHVVSRFAVGVTVVLLLATAGFLAIEQTWVTPRQSFGDQATFVAGSVGTEFVPLPVLEVLPDIDPDAFPEPRLNEATGAWEEGWIKRYGFLERRGEEATFPVTEPELASLLRDDSELHKLPVGFTLSHNRPFSPDPSPVRFVGLACAGCHSARFPDAGPGGKLVYGAGNPALDLIAFFEAFRGVLLKKNIKASVPASRRADRSATEGPDLDQGDYEYALSVATIKAARVNRKLPALTFPEELMVGFWLFGAQRLAESNTKKYDLPVKPGQLRTPRFNPVGPGRTEPFVTLDNTVLNLPAKDNRGFSKIPAVFREKDRQWAQFDGSVRDHSTRSGLAAMTAGGSVDNLGGLGIGRNIMVAARYTNQGLVGPRWEDIFGQPPGTTAAPNPTDAEAKRLDPSQLRGRAIYRDHCARCHGRPDPDAPDNWLANLGLDPQFGKIVPALNPFRIQGKPLDDWVTFKDEQQWMRQTTDPERVIFRDGRIMPYTLFTYFDRGHPRKPTGEYYPLDHPLAIARDEIRNAGGYINAPLNSLFTRAPYLHNGSIPTLTQLINLEPRPAAFLRGKNLYDPKNAGIHAPEGGPTAESAPVTESLYWWFNTADRGNLNSGHNYPWGYKEPGWDDSALQDLLAYLKSL